MIFEGSTRGIAIKLILLLELLGCQYLLVIHPSFHATSIFFPAQGHWMGRGTTIEVGVDLPLQGYLIIDKSESCLVSNLTFVLRLTQSRLDLLGFWHTSQQY